MRPRRARPSRRTCSPSGTRPWSGSPRSCRATTSGCWRRREPPSETGSTWTRRSWRPHMADPRGFLKTPRQTPTRRPVDVRILDWHEVYQDFPNETLQKQAGRCMDCGIPFCHQGCPLGNLIPEWNDLVWRDDWREAIERLHATNNFPEFTGRLCPAPCETACVLGINSDPVTIKQVEVEIVDRAWDEGWISPQVPERLSGKTIAVVGSGPAGVGAPPQLTRARPPAGGFWRGGRLGGGVRCRVPPRWRGEGRPHPRGAPERGGGARG